VIAQPLAHQPPGQFDSDDPLPEAQYLGVVGEHGAFDGEAVVCGDRTYSRHLVGADGDAESGAADQECTIGLPPATMRAAATATWG